MFLKVGQAIKVIYEPIMFQDDFWGYNIRIENISGERLIMLDNYWQIQNHEGIFERLGEDNTRDLNLLPGDICEIVGYPPLQSQDTLVIGSYMLKKENGEQFEFHIPFFNPHYLSVSTSIH